MLEVLPSNLYWPGVMLLLLCEKLVENIPSCTCVLVKWGPSAFMNSTFRNQVAVDFYSLCGNSGGCLVGLFVCFSEIQWLHVLDHREVGKVHESQSDLYA